MNPVLWPQQATFSLNKYPLYAASFPLAGPTSWNIIQSPTYKHYTSLRTQVLNIQAEPGFPQLYSHRTLSIPPVFPLHTVTEPVAVLTWLSPYSLEKRLYDLYTYDSAWHMYEVQVARRRAACIIH